MNPSILLHKLEHIGIRDGPLENLWGGGGRAKYKKIFAQGKIKWKKIHAHQLIIKKYSCYGLKKIYTRNLITKNNSCGSKIPLPPHKFSNGPSLREVVLGWFNNYLSNREQVVKYKTSISNKMTLKCGVPQDSILGPLLFVIYVNNIKNSSQILSFMFFPMILIYSWVIKT